MSPANTLSRPAESRPSPSALPRNDVRQYDELVDEWAKPHGAFAMLYWIAAARAALIPPARAGSGGGPDNPLLLDIACGGGLMAPRVRRLGYRHVGVDLNLSGLRVARDSGVLTACGDAGRLPLPDAAADVVLAGEVLEHVYDLSQVVYEACRVLRPGGTVVLDTIADTAFARFSSITLAERIPGGPPPGIHDPALFVDRSRLVAEFARHGVHLTLQGLRPSVLGYLKWLWARYRGRPVLPDVRFIPTRLTAGLFQARGVKEVA